MDDFHHRYFLLVRKVASFLGIWPTQPYKLRILRYFILGFMLLSLILIQLFCQLLTWDFNLRSLVFMSQVIIPDVCCVAQYAATVTNFSNAREAFNIMELDWQQFKNDDELKIMRKHAYQTVIGTIVCGFLLSLFIASLLLSSVLRRISSANGDISDTERFSVFFCLDHYLDSKMLYYPALIYQITIFIAMGLVCVGCYSIYFSIIQHICSRLSIVKIKLHQPFRNDHQNDIPMDLSHWMIDIIHHLGRIKEFVKLVNTVGENNYLFQMTLAFFLLVVDFLCLFQIPGLLKHEGGKSDVLMFMAFIFSNLLPIYASCYIGQRLINYSEDVYKEVCLVPIHEISLDTQKLLLTTLMVYEKPYTVMIGKVFVSSNAFFSDILRVSLSFSMMLHSTQNI